MGILAALFAVAAALSGKLIAVEFHKRKTEELAKNANQQINLRFPRKAFG